MSIRATIKAFISGLRSKLMRNLLVSFIGALLVFLFLLFFSSSIDPMDANNLTTSIMMLSGRKIAGVLLWSFGSGIILQLFSVVKDIGFGGFLKSLPRVSREILGIRAQKHKVPLVIGVLIGGIFGLVFINPALSLVAGISTLFSLTHGNRSKGFYLWSLLYCRVLKRRKELSSEDVVETIRGLMSGLSLSLLLIGLFSGGLATSLIAGLIVVLAIIMNVVYKEGVNA